ncbi:MAG TPA: cell envelope integrity protein TolA [Bacteriovoracaceae bacterium]|nr:cell envelope integrity protein TolA [Bacteriovoracaceae bacterium]
MTVISTFMIFLLIFNPTVAQSFSKKAEQPPLIELTPEQFQRVIQDQKRFEDVKIKSFLLAEVKQKTKAKAKSEEEATVDAKALEEEEHRRLRAEALERDNHAPLFHPSHGLDNLITNFSVSDSKEVALVVFAIVGTVVMVAWLVYVPVLLYDMITQKKDVNFYQLLSLQYSHIFLERQISKSRLEGNMPGLVYSLFFEDVQTYGLAAEFGYFDLTERDRGAFWAVGPSLMLGKDGGELYDFYAKFDLLAGSSFNGDLGLISKINITGNLSVFHPNFYLGLGAGAIYIDVKEDQGLASKIDELGLSILGSATWAF